ncbi:TetR/AcrR family transcriptional regulator [Actinacidiphila oryziradicis]|uniref:TetR family transcriptional regulator n=1 Tax=Actinacidiphila oryziradicis TaxID=2571141 RepID=A0A4U0S6P7_9ACTN|nr:TetR/AcrR family transcriptional regulator [Actinacidiphila oryziradicis]TKA04776.1 TetR family transcriptional regulator [Actinacidiphila oryziradicis]
MGRKSMREEIVEAAVEQFHTYGFNAAGVKDITNSAGVPKGSFYNHFESKEALAVVALERYGESIRLGELTEASTDPLLRLRQHFEFLREENISRGFARGCLVGGFGAEMADHSDMIREAVRLSLEGWAQALAAPIAQAQESGQVAAATDAKTLARFILNAWEGTLISARSDHSEDSYDIFFDTVFGTLLA